MFTAELFLLMFFIFIDELSALTRKDIIVKNIVQNKFSSVLTSRLYNVSTYSRKKHCWNKYFLDKVKLSLHEKFY